MKVGVVITLFLLGLIFAINDGPTFPWVNIAGLGLLAVCAVLSNVWSRDIGRR